MALNNYSVYGAQDHLCVVNPTQDFIICHCADERFPSADRVSFTPGIFTGDTACIQFMPRALAERAFEFRSKFLKICDVDRGKDILERASAYAKANVHDAVARAFTEVTGDSVRPIAEAFVREERAVRLRSMLMEKWSIAADAAWDVPTLEHLLKFPEAVYELRAGRATVPASIEASLEAPTQAPVIPDEEEERKVLISYARQAGIGFMGSPSLENIKKIINDHGKVATQ